MKLAGIPAVWIGLLLFTAGTAFVLWQTHKALDRGAQEATALTVAAATVALLAFALLTRMHERYMFLALAVFAPLVFLRPLRYVYAALSALFVLNLWYPYAFYNTQWWHVQGFHFDPWFSWLLGGFVTDTWQKKVWSVTVVAIALLVAWFGARMGFAIGARLGFRSDLTRTTSRCPQARGRRPSSERGDPRGRRLDVGPAGTPSRPPACSVWSSCAARR